LLALNQSAATRWLTACFLPHMVVSPEVFLKALRILAGQLLKIEVLDHIIVGSPNFSSLRTLGYFLSQFGFRIPGGH